MSGGVAWLLGVGLWAATAGASPAQRDRLANDLVIWSQATGGERVRLTALIRAGRAFEPQGQAGVSVLMLEWMRVGGTRSLSPVEAERALGQLGASLTSEPHENRLSLSLNVPPDSFRPAVRLFTDVLRYPAFDSSRLAAARSGAEVRPEVADPGVAALVGMALEREAPRHAVELSAGLERSQVVSFHRRHVRPGNMILVVDGAIGSLDAVKEVRHALAGWSRSNSRPPPRVGLKGGPLLTARAWERSPGVTGLLAGFAALSGDDHDYAAMALMGFVAAATADAALTDHGGGLRQVHYVQSLGAPDVVVIEAEVPTSEAGPGLEALEGSLRRLRDEGPSPRALERGRHQARRVLLPDREAPGAARAHAALELGAGWRGYLRLVNELDRLDGPALRKVFAHYVE